MKEGIAKTRIIKAKTTSGLKVKAAAACVVVGSDWSNNREKQKNIKLQKTLLQVNVSRRNKWKDLNFHRFNVYADGGDNDNEPIQPSKHDNKVVKVISIKGNELYVPKKHLADQHKGLCCVVDRVTYFTLCPRASSLVNNGMSAKLINAYRKAISFGNNNNRGKNCNIKSNISSFKYVCSGAAANRASRGVTPIHHVIRKLDKASQVLILDHFKCVESLFKDWLPTADIRQVLGGIDLVGAETFTIESGESSEIFAAFAVGKNVYLSCHIDDDFTYSCTTLLCSDESKKDEILAYFCFPRLGIAVPLRPGDTLFFNAREPHMVSSRTKNEIDIYCLSFYLKSNVIGGNDNSQELNEEQEHHVNLYEETFSIH